MEMAAITHMGNVRENNEDAYYLDTEHGRLFAIADGMGGHNAGEVASQMAIDTMVNVFKSGETHALDTIKAIRETFEAASAEIDAKAKENNQFEGMGTTLTLAYWDTHILYVGHIGDSRAYLVDNSGIRPITRDHTLVSELLRSGTITESEARNHPQRNVIMKALGSDCKAVPDILEVEIEEPSVLVLCSDGLSDLIEDGEIAHQIQEKSSLQEALSALKDLALARGGHDNITVVAVSLNGHEEVK